MEQKINVNPATIRNLRCTCGHMFFRQSFVIKKIPGLMVGAARDMIMHVQIWVCQECNKVHPECLPGIKEPTDAEMTITKNDLSQFRGDLNK